jgi:hypothetical protein
VDIPVALIIFRRPHTTQRVLNTLREVQPKYLFVIADAPRSEHPEESEKCQATRKLIDTVDWDCQIYKNYAETNLGSYRRVPTGLDWVFSQVEQAIVLEDDCVPHPSFFPYCQELLKRYATDQRIYTVSGNNFQWGRKKSDYSYYFSRYHHSWGWATWRRAWQHFDGDMTLWPQVRRQHLLRAVFPETRALNYWENIFQEVYDGKIRAWDYRWTLSCWLQNGLHILPGVNLVSNIGFGADASHTRNIHHPLANLPTTAMTFPLQHPSLFLRDEEADNYSQNTVYNPTLTYRLWRKLQNLIR